MIGPSHLGVFKHSMKHLNKNKIVQWPIQDHAPLISNIWLCFIIQLLYLFGVHVIGFYLFPLSFNCFMVLKSLPTFPPSLNIVRFCNDTLGCLLYFEVIILIQHLSAWNLLILNVRTWLFLWPYEAVDFSTSSLDSVKHSAQAGPGSASFKTHHYREPEPWPPTCLH